MNALLAEWRVVAVEANGGGLGSVGLDENFGFERLAFLDAIWDAELLDGDVVAVWTLKSPLSDPVVVPTAFTREEADRITSRIVW